MSEGAGWRGGGGGNERGTKPNATLLPSELRSCVSRGGRLGLPVPNKPYGFCGHKAP